MKKIPLTKGQYALVDDTDFEWLSKYHWCVASSRRSMYAVRQIGTWKKSKHLSMHRAIINPSAGMCVDHINGNTLDNRRSNLRVCTNRQNLINSKLRSDNTSGFRGVHWSKQKKKWQATVWSYDKCFHLGFFTSKKDAAKAYDVKAKELFGGFAKLNFQNK